MRSELTAKRVDLPSIPFPSVGIEELERRMLACPQKLDLPVTHRFSPGIYCRELFMPAGALVIGHRHKEGCANVVLAGRAILLSDGETREVKAGDVFTSGAHNRKMAFVLEDMRWLTFHATDETDPEKLEELLIVKSPAFLEHEQRVIDQEEVTA